MTIPSGTPFGQPQQPSAYPPVASGTPQHDLGRHHAYAYASAYAAAHPRPRSATTTLGLWALILGISGFLLPIGLNSIAAIVLGIIGPVQEQRRGMAIAGLSTGAFVLFVWIPIVQLLGTIVLSIMLSA